MYLVCYFWVVFHLFVCFLVVGDKLVVSFVVEWFWEVFFVEMSESPGKDCYLFS